MPTWRLLARVQQTPASACVGGDVRRLGIGGGGGPVNRVLNLRTMGTVDQHEKDMCTRVRAGGTCRRVGWGAAGSAGHAPLAVSAHVSSCWKSTPSNLGHVPLHRALRVSRGAMLLYCSGNVASQPAISCHSTKTMTCARMLASEHSQTEKAHSTSSHATWGYAGYALECAQNGMRQLCCIP